MSSSDEHDLSDYLLGELSPGERARFEERLREDPALRARAEGLGPLVSQLQGLPGEAWEMLPGGVEGLGGVGEETGGRPEIQQRRSPREPFWRRLRGHALTLRPLVAAAVASALLAVGVAGGVLLERSGGDSGAGPSTPAGSTVALNAIEGAPATSSALARMTAAGHMLLTVRDLPRAAAGTYYEAWLMTDRKRLVPVASFMVDASGGAHLDVPLPVSASGYRYIDISLQRAGAGTGHSERSVLRGAIPRSA